MKLRNIIFIAGLLPAITLALPSAAQTGDARRGAADYHDYGCVLCHGTIGQSTPFGVSALHPSMPIETLRWKVRNKSGIMPVFSEKILTDDDVGDLYAFIRSFPR